MKVNKNCRTAPDLEFLHEFFDISGLRSMQIPKELQEKILSYPDNRTPASIAREVGCSCKQVKAVFMQEIPPKLQSV